MRVLIATYPHAHDPAVLSYGLELAKACRAECTLAYVITRPGERTAGQAALAAQVQQAQQLGLLPQAELCLGQADEQIVHLAAQDGSTLIILGESKPDRFFGQLLAPASERVLANAPCPVLLVRGPAPRQPRKILFLHGGQQALQTLPVFLSSAGSILQPDGQMTLLHVMSHMGAGHQVSGWELAADANELISRKTAEGEWLQQGMALLQPFGVGVTPKVRHGLVVDEILAEIKQGDYDTIVLGSHGSGTWQDFLIDNVTKQVIDGTKLPVLVVPR